MPIKQTRVILTHLIVVIIAFSCSKEPIIPAKPEEEKSKEVEENRKSNATGRTGCTTITVYDDNFTVTKVATSLDNVTGGTVTTYEALLTPLEGTMIGGFFPVIGSIPTHTSVYIKDFGYYYDTDTNGDGIIQSNEIFFALGSAGATTTCLATFTNKTKIKFSIVNVSERPYTPNIFFQSSGPYEAYFGQLGSVTSNVIAAEPVFVGHTVKTTCVSSLGYDLFAISNNTFFNISTDPGSPDVLNLRVLNQCKDWTNPEVMCALRGSIYCVQGGQLWKQQVEGFIEASGPVLTSFGSGWGGSEAMAAGGDYIYTVQGGNLWKTHFVNGTTVSLGANWEGTEALAVGPDFVYGVQAGHLWRQSKTNASFQDMGGNWAGVEAMTYAPTGYLYIVHQDKLKKVNIVTGQSTIIENYGWTGTSSLVYYRYDYIPYPTYGYVYAIQGGKLWRTGLSGGSTQLGPADWAPGTLLAEKTDWGVPKP